MDRPLGIGVVGLGSVFEAYLPVIHKLDYAGKARLVMGCDRKAEASQVLEKALPEGHTAAIFTQDYSELVSSGQVDVVMVLTSMLEHAEISKTALLAGKHVLVEKPFATSLEQAQELIDLSTRNSCLFFPAPFTLLSTTYQAIARILQRGEIGKPLTARARYGWSGPWWSRWFYRQGGGAIFDLAPYNLTSLTGLLGPVKRVSAVSGTAIPMREVAGESVPVLIEDNAHILLDFGGSVFGVVTTGFTLQQYRCPAVEVYGSSGVVQMLGDDWDPDGYELWQNERGAWQVFKETQPDWPWTDGLNHLVDCIVNDVQPLVTPQHAFHVLEIMLAAQKSGREGRRIDVKSSFTPPTFPEPIPAQEAYKVHDRTHEHFQ